MNSELQPLNDYVVVQAEEAQAMTASGLHLPGNVQEKPKTARVLAVGPGKVGQNNVRIPMQLRVGDRIVYRVDRTNIVKVDDKEFSLVKEEDVLASVID